MMCNWVNYGRLIMIYFSINEGQSFGTKLFLMLCHGLLGRPWRVTSLKILRTRMMRMMMVRKMRTKMKKMMKMTRRMMMKMKKRAGVERSHLVQRRVEELKLGKVNRRLSSRVQATVNV